MVTCLLQASSPPLCHGIKGSISLGCSERVSEVQSGPPEYRSLQRPKQTSCPHRWTLEVGQRDESIRKRERMSGVVSVFSVFVFSRAIPVAYGGSQARDLIGATAATLHHTSSEPHLQPTPHRILNPLSQARDRTCNLMVPSRIRFCCDKMGTPTFLVFLTSTTFLFTPFCL